MSAHDTLPNFELAREAAHSLRDSAPSFGPSRASVAEMPTPVAVMRGILHCRKGEWHSGLHYLQAAQYDGDTTLPGLYYSYLGQALARCERQHVKALELCEHAVTIGFFEPENFLNLAWVRLLARDRRGALTAIRCGLDLDAKNRGLLELAGQLGHRKPPVLRMLPREHPLNRRLGMIRHQWFTRAAS